MQGLFYVYAIYAHPVNPSTWSFISAQDSLICTRFVFSQVPSSITRQRIIGRSQSEHLDFGASAHGDHLVGTPDRNEVVLVFSLEWL
ncbi:hypothetical protein AG1IA_08850 [Rhizoctonia solani AG-1 IA]|uniref:Uncharacterized protein n=1 Tax=Thanatephorus cucumeris (strain AG1-IA) TaxID=983506 RepID=L8WK50_THACA|nr:hypothetical protein AG1IA_08850 [Rhizoctonia solani AG-1 IA]